jgi:hypothetical protein
LLILNLRILTIVEKDYFMKNGMVFAGICQIFFITGCVSNINNTRLNISIDNVQRSEILPLKNNNDNIDLYQIGSQVMEQSGFLSEYGKSYGYYAVNVSDSNDKAPNFFICTWVNGLTLFLPSLIGFPTDLQEFDLTAYLYIFDSAGTLIKTYKNTDSFEKLAGLYYGQNPNKKASLYYSRIFRAIIEQANLQNEEINYLLRKAGPITDENMQSARIKISEFFEKEKKKNR